VNLQLNPNCTVLQETKQQPHMSPTASLAALQKQNNQRRHLLSAKTIPPAGNLQPTITQSSPERNRLQSSSVKQLDSITSAPQAPSMQNKYQHTHVLMPRSQNTANLEQTQSNTTLQQQESKHAELPMQIKI